MISALAFKSGAGLLLSLIILTPIGTATSGHHRLTSEANNNNKKKVAALLVYINQQYTVEDI